MPQSKISSLLLRVSRVDDLMFVDLQSRDAALWLGVGVGASPEDVEAIARLAALPWQLVLCESQSASLATKLEELKDEERLVSLRGFLDVIAANPEDIPLPTRTLPIFMLNGRDNSDDPLESPRLTRQKQQLRRLNMLKRLQDGQPRHLIVVSSGDRSTVDELSALWEEGFRARLTFVTVVAEEVARLGAELVTRFRVPSVTIVEQTPKTFAQDLLARSHRYTDPQRLVVSIRDADKVVQALDVSSCERPDQPILDRYDLLQVKHLANVRPEELTEEELDGFFHRSSDAWRPYAARLPWIKDGSAEQQMLNLLRTTHVGGSDENRLLILRSEPGAGGTTLMKHLAFVAATSGYPTLVARQMDFKPDPHELTGFLHSLHQTHLDSRESSASLNEVVDRDSETPALLAYDAQHWRGREDDVAGFLKAFERAGRSVAILLVMDDDRAARLPTEVTRTLDTQLSHQLTEDDAVELGQHLDRFLEPKGKSRSETDWRRFHNSNAPVIGDFGASNVSFWIALEFWLKRQLQLGETIQEWIYGQFANAGFPPDLKALVLRIAALTVERVGTPEDLMPTPPESSFPNSLRLEEVREKAPALGLTRNRSASHRQWILGHPQIARYLLNVAFRDHSLLRETGLNEVVSPILFRLELLKSIACNPMLGTNRHRELAIEFARGIFKLDRDGNREFFAEWRCVLGILEEMPERIWETSRAFNHHVAISRRRIAADEEFFPLTTTQQREQLEAAAEHLQFALDRIQESEDDDSDLALLNSLARCYQDFAQLELKTGGSKEAVDSFRAKASECIQRAKELSSTNSYVLETLARDLIQNAESHRHDDPEATARLSCEALAYIRQALALESGGLRQRRLHNLLTDSFRLLGAHAVSSQIQTMRARKDVIGIVAATWLELRAGLEPGEPLRIDDIDNDKIDRALSILDEIPAGKQTVMDLRLAYDLVAVRDSHNFSRQHDLIDAVVQETPRPDYQTRLEYAILLFQTGRVSIGKQLYDGLRNDLRRSDSFVTVPERLRFLCKQGSGEPQVCNAVVVETRDTRSWAAVQDLKRERVPFVPREFDRPRMPVGQRFQCYITFGPNGPFIKPVKGATK